MEVRSRLDVHDGPGGTSRRMKTAVLCEGWGRFPEGAFLSLRVSRADEALGESAATRPKARRAKFGRAPSPEERGPRIKGEKWRLKGTCLTPDTVAYWFGRTLFSG